MFAAWNSTQETFVKYFNNILETYKRTRVGSGTPTAAETLCNLMELYVHESDLTYLSVRVTNRSHKEDAKIVINEIKNPLNKSHEETMNKVLDKITSFKELNANSDFTILLSTFFSIHPAYLNNRNDLKSKIATQDLWESHISRWLDGYKAAHKNNGDGNNYEILAAVSQIVPADKADDFASFLLAQLKDNEHAEIQPGIYKGWVCLALGSLIDKVSPDKKTEITHTLLALLDSKQVNEHDICFIGICETLSRTNLSKNDINKVTQYLYHYTNTELPKLTKLFADHLPSTLRNYMPIIFNTIHRFEESYETPLRGTVIRLITQPDHIYPFRNGIRQLKGWFDESQKYDLAMRLASHPKFTTLQPLFCEQLANINSAVLNTAYENAVNNARNSLSKSLTESRILTDMRVLLTDNRIPAKDHVAIMEKLRETLDKCNASKTCDDLRKEIHRALVLCIQSLKNSIDRDFCTKLATAFMESALPESDNTDDMRLSAALAASELREFLDNNAALRLRNTLLDILYYSKSREAADVLLVLAKNSPQDALPNLMTSLLAIKHNGPARFLLAQVHEQHLLKMPTLVSVPKNN